MKLFRTFTILAVAALAWACSPRQDAGKPGADAGVIRFATDWRAQAEQGGFYQALATGEYEKRGLKVQIVQGGPGVNVPQLLAAGAVENRLHAARRQHHARPLRRHHLQPVEARIGRHAGIELGQRRAGQRARVAGIRDHHDLARRHRVEHVGDLDV